MSSFISNLLSSFSPLNRNRPIDVGRQGCAGKRGGGGTAAAIGGRGGVKRDQEGVQDRRGRRRARCQSAHRAGPADRHEGLHLRPPEVRVARIVGSVGWSSEGESDGWSFIPDRGAPSRRVGRGPASDGGGGIGDDRDRRAVHEAERELARPTLERGRRVVGTPARDAAEGATFDPPRRR